MKLDILPSRICEFRRIRLRHFPRSNLDRAQTHRLLETCDAQHPLDQAAAQIVAVTAGTLEQPIDIDPLREDFGTRDEFEHLIPVLAQESAVHPAESLLVAPPLRRE